MVSQILLIHVVEDSLLLLFLLFLLVAGGGPLGGRPAGSGAYGAFVADVCFFVGAGEGTVEAYFFALVIADFLQVEGFVLVKGLDTSVVDLVFCQVEWGAYH